MFVVLRKYHLNDMDNNFYGGGLIFNSYRDALMFIDFIRGCEHDLSNGDLIIAKVCFECKF